MNDDLQQNPRMRLRLLVSGLRIAPEQLLRYSNELVVVKVFMRDR
jgi:hypothetical protein